MLGYALKLKSGKWATERKTGDAVWFINREIAEYVNWLKLNDAAEVVEVRLERDCACYSGYDVREI